MVSRSFAVLVLLAAAVPTPLPAQMVQPLGLTDADLLAAQMRQLAANPRDVQALATAGELSLRIGDLSGAAALFARADKVDPRNGRVKAGMGSILVRSERPGEALRFYGQAEGLGWPAARFAADRGLAYDLIGEQERAQRDYRTALKAGADDETTRRYGLSLGISGRQAEALAALDPLVRRQDRGAWRARAFVMAMGGDAAGAAKIATGMMPAGMAQGLAAFLQRLPQLGPVDRAFAVHFGEVYATPERVADARLAPSLPALAPEPGTPPVQVAVAAAPVAVADARDRRSRRERRRDRERGLAPAVAGAPVALAQVQPLPTRAVPVAVVRPTPVGTVAAAPQPARTVPVVVAQASPAPGVVAAPQPARTVPVVVAHAPSATAAGMRETPSVTAAAMRETNVRVAAATPSAPIVPYQSPLRPVAAPGVTAAVPPSTPVAVTAAAGRPSTPVAVAAGPSATPIAVAASPGPLPTPAAAAPAFVAATPMPAGPRVAPVETAAATDRADSVLARIVASLSIPAAELEVAAVRPDPDPVPVPAAVQRAPASSVGRRIVAEASAKEARDATLRRTVAARLAGDAAADEPVRGRRGTAVAEASNATATRARRGSAVPETADAAAARSRRRGTETAAADTAPSRARGRRGAAEAEDAPPAPLDPRARRTADRKAAADRKEAADKRALADKAAADKKVTRANPARIWVQVAGGANEGDLPKAWRAVQAKTPALQGKSGYSTPLRATNRVLTGPFKTDAEARAAVNQLARQGVSAFTFTSDPGQNVKKLPAR